MSVREKVSAFLRRRPACNRAEVLDPTPVAMPVGFSRPPSMQELIARLVDKRFQQQLSESGFETIDEAEDFDMPDEFEPSSPHELVVDEHSGREMHKAQRDELNFSRGEFDKLMKAKSKQKKSDFVEEEPKPKKEEVS